jgi:hypothetical protein
MKKIILTSLLMCVLAGCKTASTLHFQEAKRSPRSEGYKYEMYYLGTKWGSHWFKIHGLNVNLFWIPLNQRERTEIYRMPVQEMKIDEQFPYKSQPQRRVDILADGTIIWPKDLPPGPTW